MKSLNRKLRYPGVYSFSSEEASVFFGRKLDIEQLQTLIEVEKQVLLYSKSGVGKTSLLNAGVIPQLPKEYEVINIRLFAYNKEMSPVRRVASIFVDSYPLVFENKHSIIDSIVHHERKAESIWYCLKKLQHAKPDKAFILVFDQFEELFSYPLQEIEDFKQQLFEINTSRIPKVFADRIKEEYKTKNPEFLDKDQFRFIHHFPIVKNVFAIRSDRLSLLNQLADKLPQIQHVFYELKALNTEQAEKAIINPAKTINKDFATRAYDFEPKALKYIIDTLSNEGSQNTETTQLQIVCQRIEEIVLKKQENDPSHEKIVVKLEDLPDFKDIFFSFYANAVGQTGEIRKTHIFIEDQLIRNGQRISLDEIICKEYINSKTLRTLTNSHLLRAEPNSTGGFSYELSHDTLIEPILVSREKRKVEEEKIRLEKERQEKLRHEKIKLEKQTIENEKKRKRQRQIISIVSIAAIVSVFFGVFGLINKFEADKQLIIAQKEKEKATKEKEKAEKSLNDYLNEQAKNKVLRIDRLFKLRESYIDAEEFKAADILVDSIIKFNVGTGKDSIRIAKKVQKIKQ